MPLDDYLNPDPPTWLQEFFDECESDDLESDIHSLNNNSYRYHIFCNDRSIVGIKHSSWKENRSNHIWLNCSKELSWLKHHSNIQYSIPDSHEIHIISGVVDYRSEGEYDTQADNFLLLTEDILDEIPPSGKKRIRDDDSGYPPPFDRHLNSWEPFYSVFDEC